MYKGKRDPWQGIVALHSCCEEMIDSQCRVWVEIFIPPRNFDDIRNAKVWSSIVIPPEQVYIVDNSHNEFFVNAGAELTCYFKEWSNAAGKRVFVGQETDITFDVAARFLQYEYFLRFGAPTGHVSMIDVIRDDFDASGLKMIEYIRRCCTNHDCYLRLQYQATQKVLNNNV